ncbi:hypothetical protein VFPPC_16395 [Pochonia chlamydosporia 170]|uniref:Uncharacterized protein n=1 Tax=Pochonia chlamydosporia 170 TaxID=1380566 RepID=A0A179FC86_METCM|nr:hypothetical protein VFPPC_16395 [Pochonia chlamydosporia 170]OAQ62881.2 hypothetical protein VFPPC_16395 [Pochonia chlamydosporia 170]
MRPLIFSIFVTAVLAVVPCPQLGTDLCNCRPCFSGGCRGSCCPACTSKQNQVRTPISICNRQLVLLTIRKVDSTGVACLGVSIASGCGNTIRKYEYTDRWRIVAIKALHTGTPSVTGNVE